MAEVSTKESAAKQAALKVHKDGQIFEAYFLGLLWASPVENYTEYHQSIKQEEFLHEEWAFFFDFGRRLYEDGVKTFDDISINLKAKEWNLTGVLEKHGGLETIEDAISIVKQNGDNIEYYFERIKKNFALKLLYQLFGDKVFKKQGNYDFEVMDREVLLQYWNDKLNKINYDGVVNVDAENLVIDPDVFLENVLEDAAETIPFYNSNLLNGITQGVPRGHVTMLGGFGNSGKSSFTAEKFVMSCVTLNEKLIVVLNEEDAQSFRQKIVLSILYHELKVRKGFDRRRMVNGTLKDEDKNLIRKALNRANELVGGEEANIKLIFMERYIMSDLEKIIKYYANRNYVNLLIDTHKVSDASTHDTRWVTFVEDMKTIYRLTRKNAGGYNLRTVVTFQLADSAIKMRYLTYDAIGEGKASKNEASILFMFRSLWNDEFQDGKNALRVFKNVKHPVSEQFVETEISLNRDKNYVALFTPKNRFGKNNDNGQAMLIFETRLGFNHFKEIGWAYIPKDFN